MNYCSQCGKTLDENAKFCSNCGTPATQNVPEDTSNRKVVFDGEIHKCPNCGETINAFELNCPTCGYEIRDSEGTKALAKLSEQLTSTKLEFEQVGIIRNFPIPNTKEDIISFMSWAVSNYDGTYAAIHRNDIDLSDAYFSVAEQCYHKAQFLFKENSKEMVEISNKYIAICSERDTALEERLKIEKCKERDRLKREKKEYRREQREDRRFERELARESLTSEQRIAIISVVAVLLAICLAVFIPLYNCNIISFNKNAVNIGIDSKQVINKDVDYVIDLLEDNGFTNVEKKAMEWNYKLNVNAITSISIDGKTRFVGSSKFERSAKIIIHYNDAPKMVSIGMSASEIRGKNYKDIVNILKDKGFVYITTDSYNEWFSARDAVRTITINGKTEFTGEEEFSLDSRISIIYFTNNIF